MSIFTCAGFKLSKLLINLRPYAKCVTMQNSSEIGQTGVEILWFSKFQYSNPSTMLDFF